MSQELNDLKKRVLVLEREWTNLRVEYATLLLHAKQSRALLEFIDIKKRGN